MDEFAIKLILERSTKNLYFSSLYIQELFNSWVIFTRSKKLISSNSF